MDMANRRPDALVEVLMLRVVNDAARRFAITASTAVLDVNNEGMVDESFIASFTPSRTRN
jgi:hypothetical protein